MRWQSRLGERSPCPGYHRRMAGFLELDGSMGEGGGQVLRTALALALVTGRPLALSRIRAGRSRPGLLRQHLTAVQAAATIGDAQVEGAEPGSQHLVFQPRRRRQGSFRFDVGSAGSALLVVQTVLPALLVGAGEVELVVAGGTHNPSAPPYEFFARAYVPVLQEMGARVECELVRHGFHPAGGGCVRISVRAVPALAPPSLRTRGPSSARRGTILLANLPRHIALRETAVVQARLGWQEAEIEVRDVVAHGPGNAVLLEVQHATAREVVCAFGRRGVRAEEVAGEAVHALEAYLHSDAPVGEHLADQLLLPMAIAGGGTLRAVAWSSHARTNAEVIARFLSVGFTAEAEAGGAVTVTCRPGAG